MKVSIIIPVYDVAAYIEKCLVSVMRQTYQGDMECLLIDDCGTDDSIAVADRMIAKYNGEIRFRIIHHESKRGISAARNTGVKQAGGDYVFFLDSDDFISDNCIELLVGKIEEDPSLELVQGRIKGKKVAKVHRTKVCSNGEIRKCFFRNGTIPVTAWNKLIKRSFLIEHQICFLEGVLFEDTPWMFCMLKYLSKVSFVNDYTYNYFKRADSIVSSAEKTERAQSFRIIYHYILTNLTPGREKEEFNFCAIRFAYVYTKYTRFAKELKDDYLQWKEKAMKYGSPIVRMKLAVSLRLEKLKYGWLPFVAWERMKTPLLIPSDIKRVLMR